MQEIEKDSIDAELLDGRNEISTVDPSSATDNTSSINGMLKDDDVVSSALPSSSKPITASIVDSDSNTNDAVTLPSSATDNTSSINGMLKDDDAVSWSLPSSSKPTTASIFDSDYIANAVVTLRDIQNAVPQESQEESFVMDQIEQNDPSILDSVRDDEEEDEDDDGNLRTSSRRSFFNKAASLPAIIVESMQEDKRRKQERQHRRQKTHDSNFSNSSDMTNPSRLNNNKTVSIVSKSSKPKTIEEELFDLTNSLMPQQSIVNIVPSNIDNENNDTSSENVDAITNIEVEEELRPLTQAENFANNANQILENIAETDNSDLEGQQQQQQGGDVGEGGSLSSRPLSIRKKQYIKNNDHWQNMQEIKRIIHSNRKTILRYARGFMLYMILPATFVAFLLFYAFNNPQFESKEDVINNRNKNEAWIDPDRPSWSWIVMFVGVRQVITFSVALGIQWLVIAYYQQPGIKFKIVRPMARLFIIQAGGIPLLLIFWGILNLILLQGTSQFANHWMFYLKRLKIFTNSNSSGLFTANKHYTFVLLLMVGTGVAMAGKRFLIGLRFGQNSYYRYADRLTSVLKHMLQVSKIARLSELNKKLGKDAEYAETKRKTIIEDAIHIDFWLQNNLYNIKDADIAKSSENGAQGLEYETNETNTATFPDTNDDVENNGGCQPTNSNMNELLTSLHLGSFSDGSIKITEMLGEWEDIELAGRRKEMPSLSAIVQFGSSLGVLNSDHPFGQYFGYCPTRYDSVECSQRIYSDLLKVQNRVPSFQEVITSPSAKSSSSSSSSDESITDATLTTLKFHTIALIAIDETGELDTDQVKQLMKLFRPTRDGDISLIDFCKSVDFVYKEIRKLRASVANEGVMNAAAEKLIDFIFYSAIIILALAAVGVDVVVLFASMATIIISFSFCVGGASSDVIKGLLFILLQRPYDIGELCIAE
jgi:hypothetical protein